jgi:hypothetical protein
MIFLASWFSVHSQVAVSTDVSGPDGSAMPDMKSSAMANS